MDAQSERAPGAALAEIASAIEIASASASGSRSRARSAPGVATLVAAEGAPPEARAWPTTHWPLIEGRSRLERRRHASCALTLDGDPQRRMATLMATLDGRPTATVRPAGPDADGDADGATADALAAADS